MRSLQALVAAAFPPVLRLCIFCVSLGICDSFWNTAQLEHLVQQNFGSKAFTAAHGDGATSYLASFLHHIIYTGPLYVVGERAHLDVLTTSLCGTP